MRWGAAIAGLGIAVGALTPLAAQAQVQPPVFNPVERLAPQAPPRLGGAVTTPEQPPTTGPNAGARVRITAAELRGNLALDGEALAAPLAGLAGQEVTLARIEEARLAVLRAYRGAGYPFTAVNAGLTPAPGGVALTFAVTEGFIAEVKLEGDIGPAGTQVLRFLERLVGVKPVTGRAIERALLLASDIPGVTVRGTLRPMTSEPGALQLVAQVERQAVSGYLNLDNRGYRYGGPWQALAVVGLNAASSLGERSEMSFFGTPTGAQWFVQGSEEVFAGGSGLRIRIYGGTGYTRPFGKIGANGYLAQARLGGIVASYPILRSRPLNLYASAQFDAFDSTVWTGFGDARVRTSLDQVRAFRGGADLAWYDTTLPLVPAGTVTGNFRVHQGIQALGANAPNSTLSARAGSNFGFTKVTGELKRTQPLFAPFSDAMVSIQGLAAGQYSRDVLPTAEKFYLGGARLLRGFYNGQVSGDNAWGVALELQLDTAFELPTEPPIGNGRATAQFYVFRDLGRTFENLRTDPNKRLSSYGGGVRVVFSDTVQLDAEVARRVTRRPDGAAADPLHETAGLFRLLVRY